MTRATSSSVIVPVSASPGHIDADYVEVQKTMARSGVSEIEEVNSSELFEIGQVVKDDVLESSVFSYDINRGIEVEEEEEEEDCVYVAVGKDEWSMDALTWTLRNIPGNAGRRITTVNLVHVFPETHYIPSLLGNLPVSSVSSEQVETYKAQKILETRQMIQKFVNTCKSSNVQVDTILIESDDASKAILDLIPVLNIRLMVLGTPRSNLRRLRSKKFGNGIGEILQNTPETCDIKIICEGKEVVLDQTAIESPTMSPHGSGVGSDGMWQEEEESNQCQDYFSCICFKSKKTQI